MVERQEGRGGLLNGHQGVVGPVRGHVGRVGTGNRANKFKNELYI